MSKRVLAGVAVAAVLLTGVGTQVAVADDKNAARIIMLDNCVEGSPRGGNLFSEIANACRCASDKTVADLSPEQIASVIANGKLRGPGGACLERSHEGLQGGLSSLRRRPARA
ncbi:hypothetical protein ACKTEK_05425 [Tepidamorphus sp. 3E244]|uniref:hypothetical protein n=1 Tax=Tepidamorphus sp. 3E244 TaxID=3385498 RepID=UPI0038FC9831